MRIGATSRANLDKHENNLEVHTPSVSALMPSAGREPCSGRNEGLRSETADVSILHDNKGTIWHNPKSAPVIG